MRPSHLQFLARVVARFVAIATAIALGASVVPGRRRRPHRRARRRRNGARSALSQRHAQQQRRGAPLRLPRPAQREVAARARTRDRVEDGGPADVGVQAPSRRQVPRRQRIHRGRRRRVDRARADGAEQPVAVHRVHEADQGGRRRRSLHDPVQDGDALSAHAFGHDAGRDDFEGRGEGHDGGLQQRQGGDRHRAVQAGPLREGRPDRARAERRLVGGRPPGRR